MLVCKYMDRNYSAVILATKRSAGVALEVNLGILLCIGDKACIQGNSTRLWNPRLTSPEVQNRGISGPIKRTDVFQNLVLKKGCFGGFCITRKIFLGKRVSPQWMEGPLWFYNTGQTSLEGQNRCINHSTIRKWAESENTPGKFRGFDGMENVVCLHWLDSQLSFILLDMAHLWFSCRDSRSDQYFSQLVLNSKLYKCRQFGRGKPTSEKLAINV